jgi:hypothetical protein
VQDHRVAVARTGEREHEGRAVANDPDVGDQRLVEDRVQGGAVPDLPMPLAADAGGVVDGELLDGQFLDHPPTLTPPCYCDAIATGRMRP